MFHTKKQRAVMSTAVTLAAMFICTGIYDQNLLRMVLWVYMFTGLLFYSMYLVSSWIDKGE